MSIQNANISAGSQLPPNGVWNKGTAPAARFQDVNQEISQVQQDLFQMLNSKGAGAASQAVIQKAQSEIETLNQDIQTSMPQYPDPTKDGNTLEAHAESTGFYPAEWDVTYRAGTPNGADLVDYEWFGGGTPTVTDNIGSALQSVGNRFQKIERFVTKALQDPLPFQQQTQSVWIFWKEPKSKALTQLFSKQSAPISNIEALAQQVNQNGLAETGYVQHAAGIGRGQVTLIRWRYTKGADGAWHRQ
jgi:hypothetical protein